MPIFLLFHVYIVELVVFVVFYAKESTEKVLFLEKAPVRIQLCEVFNSKTMTFSIASQVHITTKLPKTCFNGGFLSPPL